MRRGRWFSLALKDDGGSAVSKVLRERREEIAAPLDRAVFLLSLQLPRASEEAQ